MTTVVNVDAGNYGLRVQQANDPNGPLFYGELTYYAGTFDSAGKVVCLSRAQKTADAAIESAAAWLLVRNLGHIATALRASADAELRQ